MWNKIYLIALALVVIAAGFFTFYGYSWLGSRGNPAIAVENFEYFSNLAWAAIWFGSIILLLIANAVLWTTRRIWAMWTTFGFFTIFVLLQTFWLANSLRHFKLENSMLASNFLISPLFGAILCLVVAAFVYFNQFLISRLRGKANPPEELFLDDSEIVEEK